MTDEIISEDKLCKELIGATIDEAYIVNGILKLTCSRKTNHFKVNVKLRMLDHGDIVYTNKRRKPL